MRAIRGRSRIAALAAIVSLLGTACGGAASPSPEASTAPSSAPASPTPLAVTPEPVQTAEGGLTADGKVLIRWFVGLGTGGNPEQIAAQQKVVADFNNSDAGKRIKLALEIYQNDTAYDILKTQFASANAPDIIGPVGIRGRNGFKGVFLDLAPFIEKTKYDLSGYDPALVDFYQEGAQGQIGIPFAVFPSAILYNKDLFDEAGLAYPPHKVGEKYDGKDWTWDTLAEIGRKLTVDKNGNDATSAGFDAENIVQFGFETQWSELRRQGSMFGSGNLVADDGKTAQIPDQWRAAWNWMYEGMWTSHFIPTDSYRNSDLLSNGNPTASGNVAMSAVQLWYTCCLDSSKVKSWDVAVMPTYQGATTAMLHADTFTITKSALHPDEAFEVLTYLVNSPDLLKAYGALPAKQELQSAFFTALDEKFAPNKVDWQVFLDMQSYPDKPSHEVDIPNFLKVIQAYGAFQTKYQSTTGLDLDKEIDGLLAELQTLFNEGS